jgi:hypothetical protein
MIRTALLISSKAFSPNFRFQDNLLGTSQQFAKN